MDIQDHYGMPPENYWKPEYFQWHNTYFKQQTEQAQRLLGNSNGAPRSLDIGAGLGKSMLTMESMGFEAYGLEPSIPFYERAISKMGIREDRLKLGPVEALDYDENTFDFITFSAVFEHLYEPAKCLQKALNWLKPNGIIHIEVPSSDWLMSNVMNGYFKLRGTNYVTNLSPMHSPFHLHEFTLKSFQELSKVLNYEIVHHHIDVGSVYFLPKVFHRPLQRYMAWRKKGLQHTVYLRKGIQ